MESFKQNFDLFILIFKMFFSFVIFYSLLKGLITFNSEEIAFINNSSLYSSTIDFEEKLEEDILHYTELYEELNGVDDTNNTVVCTHVYLGFKWTIYLLYCYINK